MPPPKIFISHREKDADIVDKLFELLKEAFRVQDSEIRFTSRSHLGCQAGDVLAVALREDIEAAKLVIAIIGPETLRSTYVLLELGASWGLRTPILVTQVQNARERHVPKLFRGLVALSLTKKEDCETLIERIRKETELEPRPRSASKDTVDEKVEELIQAAQESISAPERLYSWLGIYTWLGRPNVEPDQQNKLDFSIRLDRLDRNWLKASVAGGVASFIIMTCPM